MPGRRSGGGLFDSALEARLARQAPLAVRLRPRSLDDVVGQEHLVGIGAPLRALIESDRLSSAILWGPPGSGKTTIARVAAASTDKDHVALSAVSAGVKEVREVIDGARRLLAEHGRGTILFLDEVHRFSRTQQDALLPAVEDGLVVLVGATTENPFFELNGPLLSRSALFRLERLADAEVAGILERALRAEDATADPGVLEHLVKVAAGDARAGLNTLEMALALGEVAQRTSEKRAQHVSLADAEAARGARLVAYGTDDHYDIVSALIKSVRGSDPDSALYWMARMIESGDTPRFIARRMVILASEDVGLADPIALVVADAASRAVEVVGMPEAALNLAEAVVYLSLAPKSNSVTVALSRAVSDARSGPAAEVPAHLRSGGYRGAASLGHGEGYEYPHDHPGGHVEQDYRPPELAPHVYYEPGEAGSEPGLFARRPSAPR